MYTKKMAETYTNSEQETATFACALAKSLRAGSFIALTGDLGAGKTAFTKGIAQGLGIAETIVSPTFTLLRVYESGAMPLYHFDVYRIGSPEELDDIGFYEYAAADGICVCEWADLIEEQLPREYLLVKLNYAGDTQRKITVEQVGA